MSWLLAKSILGLSSLLTFILSFLFYFTNNKWRLESFEAHRCEKSDKETLQMDFYPVGDSGQKWSKYLGKYSLYHFRSGDGLVLKWPSFSIDLWLAERISNIVCSWTYR